MASLTEKLSKSKLVTEHEYIEKEPEFINTGCLPLNILFSGQVDGGIELGKISMIAAPSSLGKSFIGLKVARNAQRQYGMTVLYIDTEKAFDREFARGVGVNLDEMVVVQNNRIETVQQLIMQAIEPLSKEERENLLILIDSWGGLTTSKTVNDALDGKDVTDMTISKKKNSLSRLLLGIDSTVFVVNQTYETMDQYNPLAVGGGKGIRFASSAIVMGTSKAKSKESGEVDGAIISATADKGRRAVEKSKLKYRIKYNGGIDPYYGILEDALDGGYVIKPNQGWYTRPSVENDKKWREKEIWDSGTDFWSPIIKETDFKVHIEKKYSFKHNEIRNLEEADTAVDELDDI